MKELLQIKYLERKPLINESQSELMVLIHGYGSNETDLFSFADQLPGHYHIISLRAIRNTPFGGFSWYDINFTQSDKHTDFEQAAQSCQQIKKFVAAFLEKEKLFDKASLCGFSQGCVLSYSLALHYPALFKKVIALSGYPADEILPQSPKKEVSELSFFISHGLQDTIIPIKQAKKAENLMKQWNIPYVYREYRAGHTISASNFQDMIQWLHSN